MSTLTADNYFAIIPEWLLYSGVSSRAVHVYAILARHANTNGVALPSRRRIAEAMGVRSVDTIDRAVNELVEVGALTVEARFTSEGDRTSNAYHLRTTPPKSSGGSRKSAATDRTDREGGRADAATGGRTDAAQNQSLYEPEPSSATTAPARPIDDECERRPPTATAESSRRQRKPDRLWDAVMDACHVTTEAITSLSRGGYNAAVKAIREAGGQPEQVAAAAAKYRRTYEKIPTPQALAKHWPQMVDHARSSSSTTCPKCQQPNGAAHNDWSCQMIQRSLAETA